MVTTLRSLFYAVVDLSWIARPRVEEEPKIGGYPVDYSEPTQEEIDTANASCAEVFKNGNWVPVNRKS
jgi:hypothetical protein